MLRQEVSGQRQSDARDAFHTRYFRRANWACMRTPHTCARLVFPSTVHVILYEFEYAGRACEFRGTGCGTRALHSFIPFDSFRGLVSLALMQWHSQAKLRWMQESS